MTAGISASAFAQVFGTRIRRWGLHTLVLATVAWGTAVTARADEVLHRGIGVEPASLDPQAATGTIEAGIIHDLHEGLLALSADGLLAPGVAESWRISSDGRLYTFRLRADAKWSNGETLTAEDFVYSLRRAADPANAFENASLLWPIGNAAKVFAGVFPVDQLAVQSPDPRTLTIKLAAPSPDFLERLTHQIYLPVHRATVETFGSDWTKPGHSVMNGAYMMSEWTPDGRIVAVKNPNYWDAANVRIESVVFHRMDDTAQFEAFRTGALDMTDAVPIDKVRWAAANLPEEFRKGGLFATCYYVINMARGPLGRDVRLRKALALAIDRDLLVETVTQGGEAPAYKWVPPGIPGYDEARAQRLPRWALRSSPSRRKPEKWFDSAYMTQTHRNQLAQTLMTEAGYGPNNPLRVDVLFNASERNRAIVIAITDQWRRTLGVETTLTPEDWDEYLERRNHGQFEVARAAWVGASLDPLSFLGLFGSDNPGNDARYINVRFRQLIADAAFTTDPEIRNERLALAEEMLLADLPIIPIYHFGGATLVGRNVQGVVENPMGFHLTRHISKD
jgi:oligopeptide transport system substrate-binding protein